MGRPRFFAWLVILWLSVVSNTIRADSLEDVRQLIRAKEFDDAIQALELLHDKAQGTGESHYLLGSLYWLQEQGERDVTKPLAEFEKAVGLKHPKAMHRLGVLYLVGVEVPQDIARARDLLSTANQLGYQLADTQLLHAQSDFFDMEEWDVCTLIDYQRDGMLLSSEDWSNRTKKRAFFCAVAASNLRALEMWLDKGWGLLWQNRWGQTGLHMAINAKSYATLAWLLRHGVSVDTPDNRGNTPLHLAVALQDQTSIDLLLQYQADWSVRNNADAAPLDLTSSDSLRAYALGRGARAQERHVTKRKKPVNSANSKVAQYGVFAEWPPINVAAWLDKKNAVKILLPRADLAATDPENYTALMRAACAGHHSVYQILQSAGAHSSVTPEQRIALVQCLAANPWRDEFTDAARELDTNLMDVDEFNNLLGLVATAGLTDELQVLLSRELERRRVNAVTLKRIVQLNNKELTAQIFEFAKPEIQQRVFFDALKYGWEMPANLLQLSVKNQWVDAELDTPLIASSSAGNVEAITALIPVSEIDAQNKAGNTALHSAVLGNHPAAVRVLLHAACDVEIRNKESLTPLMLAVDTASDELIQLLLAAGANPDRRDKFGVSVVDRAKALGRSDLEDLLRG
ncbi:MAG: ankyrin repeat domain-containing protein [Halieaceae bacterium]|nr:ankyrin repeat domain-containing protein [Halieaceae bacterium]